jgi:hypothetical protein
VTEPKPVTFYTAEGGQFTTSDPGQINRLKLSRSHFLSPQEAADPLAAEDTRFHPDNASVDEVHAYLQEFPTDAERVLAEERSGKARKGIIGE